MDSALGAVRTRRPFPLGLDDVVEQTLAFRVRNTDSQADEDLERIFPNFSSGNIEIDLGRLQHRAQYGIRGLLGRRPFKRFLEDLRSVSLHLFCQPLAERNGLRHIARVPVIHLRLFQGVGKVETHRQRNARRLRFAGFEFEPWKDNFLTAPRCRAEKQKE